MDTLLRLGITFTGIVTLGLVWFGLQAAIRRWVPSMLPPDGGDPFRARFGCGGSCATGECGTDHAHAH